MKHGHFQRGIVGRYSPKFCASRLQISCFCVDFRALDLPLLTMPRRATRPVKPATARDAVAMPRSTTHQTCYLYQKTFSQVANKKSTIKVWFFGQLSFFELDSPQKKKTSQNLKHVRLVGLSSVGLCGLGRLARVFYKFVWLIAWARCLLSNP